MSYKLPKFLSYCLLFLLPPVVMFLGLLRAN